MEYSRILFSFWQFNFPTLESSRYLWKIKNSTLESSRHLWKIKLIILIIGVKSALFYKTDKYKPLPYRPERYNVTYVYFRVTKADGSLTFFAT